MTQTKHIQAYSLLEYTQQIEQAISEGYSFRLSTNEGCCQQIGFYFEVLMYKTEVPALSTVEKYADADLLALNTSMKDAYPDVKSTAQPQKQRGRPSTK